MNDTTWSAVIVVTSALMLWAGFRLGSETDDPEED